MRRGGSVTDSIARERIFSPLSVVANPASSGWRYLLPTHRFDEYRIVSKVRFTARKFEASSMESTVRDTIFKNLGFARTLSKAPEGTTI